MYGMFYYTAMDHGQSVFEVKINEKLQKYGYRKKWFV